jgi:hypothetical protein
MVNRVAGVAMVIGLGVRLVGGLLRLPHPAATHDDV